MDWFTLISLYNSKQMIQKHQKYSCLLFKQNYKEIYDYFTVESWLWSHSLFHRNNCIDIQYREPERVNRNLKSSLKKAKRHSLSYISFIRPALEYSCSVWHPHQKSNKEKVQRRAALIVSNNFRRKASVWEILHLSRLAIPRQSEAGSTFSPFLQYY